MVKVFFLKNIWQDLKFSYYCKVSMAQLITSSGPMLLKILMKMSCYIITEFGLFLILPRRNIMPKR